MRWIDMHCDVLSKLIEKKDLRFSDDPRLDVNLARMKQGNVKLQAFAVYIPGSIEHPTFEHVLKEADLFYERVTSEPGVIPIQTKSDLQRLGAEPDSIGAMITVEGLGALDGSLMYLRTLYRLGVRAVGITWNFANWAADGVMEPRKGGFTQKGRQLIVECDRLGMTVDVSHLSETAFWQLLELSPRPFIASHSNAYAVCPHPRNLSDDQIRAIAKRRGMIGITFVPWFVKNQGPVKPYDVFPHIDHMIELGAEGCIGFGSDYDGIESWIEGLHGSDDYAAFQAPLAKRYGTARAERFAWGNWHDFWMKQLP